MPAADDTILAFWQFPCFLLAGAVASQMVVHMDFIGTYFFRLFTISSCFPREVVCATTQWALGILQRFHFETLLRYDPGFHSAVNPHNFRVSFFPYYNNKFTGSKALFTVFLILLHWGRCVDDFTCFCENCQNFWVHRATNHHRTALAPPQFHGLTPRLEKLPPPGGMNDSP